LAAGVSDKTARDALLAYAEEADAKADELEEREAARPDPPPERGAWTTISTASEPARPAIGKTVKSSSTSLCASRRKARLEDPTDLTSLRQLSDTGTGGVATGSTGMQTPDRDPADLDPNERQMMRGSRASSVGPWVILILLAMIGFGAYALLGL